MCRDLSGPRSSCDRLSRLIAYCCQIHIRRKKGNKTARTKIALMKKKMGPTLKKTKDGDCVVDAEANQEDEGEDEDVGDDNKDEPHGQKRVHTRQDDKTANKK